MKRSEKIKTLDNMFYKKIGNELRNKRQEQNMTLVKLSKKTGISREQLDYYELGYSKIKPEKWEIICKALHISSKINVNVSLN